MIGLRTGVSTGVSVVGCGGRLRAPMRVLLLNQVFYPDVAATAQHAHDLAKHLVEHGHEVHAIASRSIYGERGGKLAKYEVVDGVHVHRVGQSLFGKSSISARLLDFGLFYVQAGWKALRVPRPDVTVCFTTPPFIALVGVVLRWLRGSRFVYWVMDLYPDIAVVCGVLGPRSPATRVFERLNRFALRQADRAVVLGRCMQERVREKGVDRGHVVHIGVWSGQVEMEMPAREANPYREEWGLGDRFVVMYSGNFGLAHDVATFLEAAMRLKDDDGIRFVFAGGGKKKAEVEAFVAEHGLDNCVLAEYQPRAKLHESLGVADVHLASMVPGSEGVVVPCKLFGIMAAGKPTLFIGRASSELGRVLHEHGAGEIVEPGDAAGLVSRIRGLAADRSAVEKMAERARVALREAYGRESACASWRVLLEETVAEHHPNTTAAADAT